jgi:hypothetical protein
MLDISVCHAPRQPSTPTGLAVMSQGVRNQSGVDGQKLLNDVALVPLAVNGRKDLDHKDTLHPPFRFAA